jgi:hypothetical protein
MKRPHSALPMHGLCEGSHLDDGNPMSKPGLRQ